MRKIMVDQYVDELMAAQLEDYPGNIAIAYAGAVGVLTANLRRVVSAIPGGVEIDAETRLVSVADLDMSEVGPVRRVSVALSSGGSELEDGGCS